MSAGDFVLQSIVVADDRMEVSYHDPATITPHGLTISTAVINLGTGALDAEIAELYDAALQLVTAHGGLQREAQVRGPTR